MIQQRISLLRQWMQKHAISILLIPTSDPHQSEYTAEYWKCRQWITGFTGSAGTAIVSAYEALLWTDSRYWLQAEEELKTRCFKLMRDGKSDVPSIREWIVEQVQLHPNENNIGLLGYQTSYEEWKNLTKELPSQCIIKICSDDPFSELWKDRPSLPQQFIEIHPLSLSGESTPSKMKRLSQLIQTHTKEKLEGYFISDLSEIAWLLNLRGADIDYNPLFMSYFWFDFRGKSILFVNKNKLNADIHNYLLSLGIETIDYERMPEIMKEKSKQGSCLGLSTHSPIVLIEQLREAIQEKRIKFLPSPIEEMKAIKNTVELDNIKKAMEKDGRAMVRFLRRLEERAPSAIFTEMSCDLLLTSLRQEEKGFKSLSFATIAGYNAHGAIVHYEANESSDIALEDHGLLLLDSGAQYNEGTTDLTRTIAMGECSEEEKRVYTLVLKGHIGLSRLRFPKGTVGLALDLSARQAMWKEGYDFGHGTGHGVGASLCVHEGPHQIRKDLRKNTLVGFVPGMTITDEPGIYVTGKFGVRIENVLCVVDDGENDFGHWCKFEPLTLCPIDLRPIKIEWLTDEEIEWINTYHDNVRNRLLPLLSEEADRNFLLKTTTPLTR